MSFLDRLEKRLGFLAVPNLLLTLLVGQVVVFFTLRTGYVEPEQILLSGRKLLAGEWWRMFTFLFQPMQEDPSWFALGLYFTWIIGIPLEQQLGEFRFNLFFAMGWLATVGACLLVPDAVAGNGYLFALLTLVFARLYPDVQFLVFLLFPVKVKYLAWILWASFGLTLVFGTLAQRVVLLAALLPYGLLFGPERLRALRANRRRFLFQQTARASVGAARHTCSVCGSDSNRQPDLEFRYRGSDCICENCLREGK